MQIEGSANEDHVKRIEDVIKEHYDETMALLLNITVTHVLDDKVYIVQHVVAWEGDDDYTIHTETVRVDFHESHGAQDMLFTLLSEHDLQLKDEL